MLYIYMFLVIVGEEIGCHVLSKPHWKLAIRKHKFTYFRNSILVFSDLGVYTFTWMAQKGDQGIMARVVRYHFFSVKLAAGM